MSKTFQNNPKQSKTIQNTYFSTPNSSQWVSFSDASFPTKLCRSSRLLWRARLGMKWWWSKWPKRRRCSAIRQTRGQPRMANALKCRRKTMNMWVIWSWYFLHIRLFSLTLFFSDFILSKSFSERHHSHRSSRVFQSLTWIPFLEDMLSPDMRKFFPYSWMNLSPAVNKCEQYRWRHAKKPRSS